MRIYKSHHGDVEIPNLDILTLLFGELAVASTQIDEMARRLTDFTESDWCGAKEETKIHIEAANPDNYITKSEARKVIRKTSHVLRNEYGIGLSGSGRDVVLLTALGNPFIPILFYSIVAAGGVYSGASTAFTVSELVSQAKDSGARLLLCSPEFRDRTIEAACQSGIPLDHVLLIDAKKRGQWKLISLTNSSVVPNLESCPMHDWTRITEQEDLEATTTCLLYSSGTTGLPKGVRISHRNLVAANVCAAPLFKQSNEAFPFFFSTIAHLPTAHIGGITWSSMIPFYFGGSAYWVEKYDFESFIEYHRRYRLTVQWTVPPIWLAIAQSPKVTDHFDSLRSACTGAAPMGPELSHAVAQKLGKGKIPLVTQLWGSTETTGTCTGIDWNFNDETCSHGAPFANHTLRFIDESGQDVEPGSPGEVLVSGPLVCQGYHNQPEAQNSSFLDGFYRTGDVGLWRDGLVHIVDRLKELIKYKGLQVAPAELEGLLISHPHILDAAVIGISDAVRATEVPYAFVVTKLGANLQADEVMDFVKKNLADHKRLRGGVGFVPEIPKSASGKILRKELRKRYRERNNQLPPKARL